MRARIDSVDFGCFRPFLRQAGGAFEQYALDQGGFPPDRTPGVIPPGTAAQILALDTQFDNGDLGSGLLRQRAQGYIYVLEE